ncbi:MAG: CPBP family intramembrane metalloprotease, partial [Gemmatimonadota bacterium]|nr:CPBP family intramembrane metalloprotease [Gemmatimonadota bacterium]
PWVLPIHLALGLAFGYAVWATRSIWSGVVLHAANNAVATLGLRGEATPTPTVWETGDPASLLQALGVLVIACGAAVWVGRQLVGSRPAAP